MTHEISLRELLAALREAGTEDGIPIVQVVAAWARDYRGVAYWHGQPTSDRLYDALRAASWSLADQPALPLDVKS